MLNEFISQDDCIPMTKSCGEQESIKGSLERKAVLLQEQLDNTKACIKMLEENPALSSCLELLNKVNRY